MNEIGKILLKARSEKGWSQAKLAEESGLSIDWVRKVEQGRSMRPSYEALMRAAKALGIPPVSLIPGYMGTDVPEEMEYRPREEVETINASLRTLKRLSPEGLMAAYKFLETFSRMDEDEFAEE